MKCKVDLGGEWEDGVIVGQQTKKVGWFKKRSVRYYLVTYTQRTQSMFSPTSYTEKVTRSFPEGEVVQMPKSVQ